MALYKDGERERFFTWDPEDLPDGLDNNAQFRPTFEDGEVVSIDYDESLTEKVKEDIQDGIENGPFDFSDENE